MKRILCLLALCVPLWAQTIPQPNWTMPPGYHVATVEEFRIELAKQYDEMARSGWCCDPPITLGFMSIGSGYGWAEEPAAFTDGLRGWRTAYLIIVGTKTCILTKEQYFWRRREISDRVYVPDEKRSRILVSLCATDKLPRYPR